MANLRNNYYFSSFFWSTFQKILNAVINFISVPLLLGYYGKIEYGILGIATACNGYMHLLDLGMNTGAVKFYSQWRSEGKNDLISHVARTNISFYGIISFINIIGLLALAIWGEGLFAVSHEHFILLRKCLIIIAFFSIFSWGATTFEQLLIADLQIAFTMQVQSVIAVLKAALIGMIFLLNLSLTEYFFILTTVIAVAVIPYVLRCIRCRLIDSIRPALYWKDFKIVILFSLSIFALSLFQMTATQSRPIILSIFAVDGADTVADFKIIEVVPLFIIMICGTFSSIFLPKASCIVSQGIHKEEEQFAYKWTVLTSIISNCLCFPFILGARDVISAYVGNAYEHLSYWLVVWTICVLFQVHSTPANALILARGKTKVMVYISALACVVSMIINAILANKYGVGSAIIGYAFYIVINLISNYFYYYKKVLNISIITILYSFLYPTFWGVLSCILVFVITNSFSLNSFTIDRYNYILEFVVKAICWVVFYLIMLLVFRVIMIKDKKLMTKFDIQ